MSLKYLNRIKNLEKKNSPLTQEEELYLEEYNTNPDKYPERVCRSLVLWMKKTGTKLEQLILDCEGLPD